MVQSERSASHRSVAIFMLPAPKGSRSLRPTICAVFLAKHGLTTKKERNSKRREQNVSMNEEVHLGDQGK